MCGVLLDEDFSKALEDKPHLAHVRGNLELLGFVAHNADVEHHIAIRTIHASHAVLRVHPVLDPLHDNLLVMPDCPEAGAHMFNVLKIDSLTSNVEQARNIAAVCLERLLDGTLWLLHFCPLDGISQLGVTPRVMPGDKQGRVFLSSRTTVGDEAPLRGLCPALYLETQDGMYGVGLCIKLIERRDVHALVTLAHRVECHGRLLVLHSGLRHQSRVVLGCYLQLTDASIGHFGGDLSDELLQLLQSIIGLIIAENVLPSRVAVISTIKQLQFCYSALAPVLH
mmetsp:Transcript_2927/g.7014  ORF Transcript_2927/g.7014 Transcript_2927/m.7014 type:complete len:282 (+) Transcript_2927:158-1003(+)